MSGPGTALRVLLVEDSENDALLLLDVLERGGYEPVYERVQTTEEMERALREASERRRPWEVVLSDYYMPRFRASSALALLRRLGYQGVGVGQQSMRQRAREIGGVLEVESAPGGGTRVRFEAPVSRMTGR